MFKTIAIALVVMVSLILVGCSKDAEINAFLTDWDGLTQEMVKKIETGDIDGAKAAFDAKKVNLKAKWAEIKDARGFQVGKETQDKMQASATKNMSDLQGAMMKNVMALAADKPKMDKLQALVQEYAEIFK